MKFLAAVLFAVGVFAEDDQVQKLTDEYTDAFVQAVSEGNADGLEKFWDNNTELNFASELPFGGHYTKDNITLFGSRFDKTFDTGSGEKKILAVDEAKGTALVLSTCKHTFKTNEKPLKMEIVHALQWNTANDKLISHDMIDKNVEETLDKYRTLAEKKLWAMIWATYKAGPEGLKDGSSPVYGMISEDVQVKLNMHPDDIVSTTEFNNKNELIAGMKEWWDLGKKMPAHKDMEKQVKELKVLYADDNEVFVEKKGGKAIAHYTFDEGNDGLLIAEEVLLNEELKPWDVYPFPIPMEEDDDDDDDNHDDDDDDDDKDDDEDDDEDEAKYSRRSSGKFKENEDDDEDDDDDDQQFGRRSAKGLKGQDDDDDNQKFVLQREEDDDTMNPRRSGDRRGRQSQQGRSFRRGGSGERSGRN